MLILHIHITRSSNCMGQRDFHILHHEAQQHPMTQYYLPCSFSEHKERKIIWPLIGILNAFSFHSSSLWE